MDYPAWANTPQLRLHFALRHAALYHNQQGSFNALASAIGVTKHTFYSAVEKGQTTPQIAIALELLLGTEIAARENFCSLTVTQ